MSTVERCEQCIQVARFKVELSSGELYFCNHHYQKAAAALMVIDAAILELVDASL